jgi:hypothetical protein
MHGVFAVVENTLNEFGIGMEPGADLRQRQHTVPSPRCADLCRRGVGVAWTDATSEHSG